MKGTRTCAYASGRKSKANAARGFTRVFHRVYASRLQPRRELHNNNGTIPLCFLRSRLHL